MQTYIIYENMNMLEIKDKLVTEHFNTSILM